MSNSDETSGHELNDRYPKVFEPHCVNGSLSSLEYLEDLLSVLVQLKLDGLVDLEVDGQLLQVSDYLLIIFAPASAQ